MALRRYHRPSQRSESRMISIAVRVAAILAAVLAVLVILALVLINGERIKAPLENALGQLTGSEVTIGKAEFSPLYPDTVKVTDVSIKHGDHNYTIAEAYAEAALWDSLFSDTLYFEDLYLRGFNFPPDFLKEAAANLPYPALYFKTFRLEDFKLENTHLSIESGSLRLTSLKAMHKNFEFEQGFLALRGVIYEDLPIKNLQTSFKPLDDSAERFELSDFSGSILGGSFLGAGQVNLTSKELALSKLSLAKTILKSAEVHKLPVSLTAKEGSLFEVFLDNESSAVTVSGITGSFKDLSLNKNGIAVSFNGRIEELSKPDLEAVLTHNIGEAQLTPDKLFLNLQGEYAEGSFSVRALAELNEKTLYFDDLKLDGAKLEVKSKLADFIENGLKSWTVHLDQGELSHVRVLSFINTLPISAESLSLNASALRFDKNGVHGQDTALVSLNLENFLYSDLLVSKASLMGTLADSLITISSPQISFKGSELSFSAAWAKKPGAQSYFLLRAHDFDLASLNSNLLNHLFAGTISAEASLRADSGDFDAIINTLDGTASLTSSSILVSKFGLDLINGGYKKTYDLSLSEFLTALEAQDSGISDLNLSLHFKDGRARAAGNFDLPVSHVFVNHSLDLKKGTLSGFSTFTSHLKDSVTEAALEGTLQAPRFKISAIKRGELRPGLFLDLKEDSLLEEQTADPNLTFQAAPAPAPKGITLHDLKTEAAGEAYDERRWTEKAAVPEKPAEAASKSNDDDAADAEKTAEKSAEAKISSEAVPSSGLENEDAAPKTAAKVSEDSISASSADGSSDSTADTAQDSSSNSGKPAAGDADPAAAAVQKKDKTPSKIPPGLNEAQASALEELLLQDILPKPAEGS